jgi:hypothetical protein
LRPSRTRRTRRPARRAGRSWCAAEAATSARTAARRAGAARLAPGPLVGMAQGSGAIVRASSDGGAASGGPAAARRRRRTAGFSLLPPNEVSARRRRFPTPLKGAGAGARQAPVPAVCRRRFPVLLMGRPAHEPVLVAGRALGRSTCRRHQNGRRRRLAAPLAPVPMPAAPLAASRRFVRFNPTSPDAAREVARWHVADSAIPGRFGHGRFCTGRTGPTCH